MRDTVRSTTYERHEQITRKHIIPEVGRVKIKALTPAHVRGLYRKKLEAGLSPRSVDGRGPFVGYCCHSSRPVRRELRFATRILC